MARINDRLVVQRVGDHLIVMDDQTQVEVPVALDDAVRLVAMAAYLTDPQQPGGVLERAADYLVAVGAITAGGDAS